MPHSFSYAVSMNLEHSIKEGSHERYTDHFQCFRNIKKIKYPDFQGHDICIKFNSVLNFRTSVFEALVVLVIDDLD